VRREGEILCKTAAGNFWGGLGVGSAFAGTDAKTAGAQSAN